MLCSPMAMRPKVTASTRSSGRRRPDRSPAGGRTARPGTGSSPAAAIPDARRRRSPTRASTLARLAVGPIDFLGRLRREENLRAGLERDRDIGAVAARHAAAGIDQHRLARPRRPGESAAAGRRSRRPAPARCARRRARRSARASPRARNRAADTAGERPAPPRDRAIGSRHCGGLRLRLAGGGLFAATSARHFVDARLQESRARLGQPRRAKTMRAFAGIVPAGVLAVGGKARLVAGEVVGLGADPSAARQERDNWRSWPPPPERARVFDRLGRRREARPPPGPRDRTGSPGNRRPGRRRRAIAAGTRTAPSRTSNSNGQAGISAENRSNPSGRPRLLTSIGAPPPTSIRHCLLGVRNDLADNGQPIDAARPPRAPGKLQLAIRAVEQQRRARPPCRRPAAHRRAAAFGVFLRGGWAFPTVPAGLGAAEPGKASWAAAGGDGENHAQGRCCRQDASCLIIIERLDEK